MHIGIATKWIMDVIHLVAIPIATKDFKDFHFKGVTMCTQIASREPYRNGFKPTLLQVRYYYASLCLGSEHMVIVTFISQVQLYGTNCQRMKPNQSRVS